MRIQAPIRWRSALVAAALGGGALTAQAADPPLAAQPTCEAAASGCDAAPAGPTRWMPSAEWSGGFYRWSLSHGALGIGFNFDMAARAGRFGDARSEPTGPLFASLQSVSVGLHRVRSGSSSNAGTLLDRAGGIETSDAYVSKVGVEWKPAQSQVNFLREGLGIRLDGGNRMTVRLRKGVVGLYLLRNF